MKKEEKGTVILEINGEKKEYPFGTEYSRIAEEYQHT